MYREKHSTYRVQYHLQFQAGDLGAYPPLLRGDHYTLFYPFHTVTNPAIISVSHTFIYLGEAFCLIHHHIPRIIE